MSSHWENKVKVPRVRPRRNRVYPEIDEETRKIIDIMVADRVPCAEIMRTFNVRRSDVPPPPLTREEVGEVLKLVYRYGSDRVGGAE